jgi:hypothetical protein
MFPVMAASNIDRLVFAGLYHLAPEVLDAVKILKPRQAARATRISSGNRFEAPLVNMGDCREAVPSFPIESDVPSI